MKAELGGYAPVAVFAYRRVDKLGQALDALERCEEFSKSPVYIFSDGAKDDASSADVAAVRAFVRARLHDNMCLVESGQNMGCDQSIVQAVTRLCDDYGKVIVIEDDLIVSPAILGWFNAALNRYADDARVMQISGHMFDVPGLRARTTGLMLPFTTSWGWATWRRAWDHFDPDASGWRRLVEDRAMRRRFDLGGRYPYVRAMEQQMAEPNPAWDIRWYWTVFKLGGLCLFPPRSLVSNVGSDSLATHGTLKSRLAARLRRKRDPAQTMPALPSAVDVDAKAFDQVAWATFFRRI